MKRKIAKLIVCTSLLSLVATGCGAKATVNADSTEVTAVTEEVTTESETETTETESTEMSEYNATIGETTAQTLVTEHTYTYTDAESVMYAKSSVNVRDLPSAYGAKLGGLFQNQEITVTGTCNETGWYRIAYQDSVGYVSNKYLVSEQTAAPATAPATPAPTEVKGNIVIPAPVVTTSSSGAAAPSGSSIRDGFDLSTDEGMMAWLQAGHSSSEIINEDPGVPTFTSTSSIRADSYEVGKKVLELINQDRASEGIPALIWSDDLYNIAMQRCMENDGHNGMRAGTSENCSSSITENASAEDIFSGVSTSPHHRANYMNPAWTHGAAAASQTVCTDGWNNGVAYEVFQ